jgi:drug/metabolite transporter (DMT)-like permease
MHREFSGRRRATFARDVVLWVRSVQVQGAHQAMVYTYPEPIFAVLIAAAVLGESLSAVQGVGAPLTPAGFWYAVASAARHT